MKIFSLLVILMFVIFSCNNNSVSPEPNSVVVVEDNIEESAVSVNPSTPDASNPNGVEYLIWVDYNDDGEWDYNNAVFPGYDVALNLQESESKYINAKIVDVDNQSIVIVKLRIRVY